MNTIADKLFSRWTHSNAFSIGLGIIESRFSLESSFPPTNVSPRDEAAARLRAGFQSLSEMAQSPPHATPLSQSPDPSRPRSRLHRLLSLCPCPIDHLATGTNAAQTHPFVVSPSVGEKVPSQLLWILVILGLSSAAAVVEIVGGHHSESASLLADGWHMVAHVFAIGLAALVLVRKRRAAPKHSLDLASTPRKKFQALEIRVCLANAVLLIGAGIFTAWDAVAKLTSPVDLHSHLAMGSACAGLTINAVCALVIRRKFNLSEPGVRSAFLHVVADLVTSVLAIAAILLSAVSHLTWIDPVLGLLGGVWIALMGIALLNDLRGNFVSSKFS